MSEEWFQGNVLTNSVRIHYYRPGGENGNQKPPVILCHGSTDNGLCWSELARDLMADYDVIMVDARCHGRSEAPRSGNSTTAMAHDLGGLIQVLNIDRPVCAGHSMGSAYVSEAAALYPELIRAIILEDPVWRNDVPWAGSEDERNKMANKMAADIRRINQLSVDELIEESYIDWPRWSEPTRKLWAVAQQQVDERMVDSRRIPRAPWRKVVADLKCPVQIYTGSPALGSLLTEEMFQVAQAIAPQIQRVHVPAAGHCIRYEQYELYRDAFITALERFFAD